MKNVFGSKLCPVVFATQSFTPVHEREIDKIVLSVLREMNSIKIRNEWVGGVQS